MSGPCLLLQGGLKSGESITFLDDNQPVLIEVDHPFLSSCAFLLNF